MDKTPQIPALCVIGKDVVAGKRSCPTHLPREDKDRGYVSLVPLAPEPARNCRRLGRNVSVSN